MPVEEQVVSIYAGTKGYLDDIPTSDVGRFESELLEEFRSRYSDLLDEIKESGKLPDDDKLKKAMEGFKDRFQPTETGPSDADKKADEAKKSGDDKKSDDDEKSDEARVRRRRVEMDTKAEEQLARGQRAGARPPAAHQERPVHQEDHPGHGADRGQPHRQGPAAGGRRPALLRADHRGHAQPGRRRRRPRPSPAAGARPGQERSASSSSAADRGLAGAYNSTVIRTGRAGPAGRTRPRARTTR